MPPPSCSVAGDAADRMTPAAILVGVGLPFRCAENAPIPRRGVVCAGGAWSRRVDEYRQRRPGDKIGTRPSGAFDALRALLPPPKLALSK